MIKYANFHWRQWPGSTICGASSLVMQGQLKSTSLPTDQLLTYNQETIQKTESAITWQQLFTQNTSVSENSSTIKSYPAFSKNVIQLIQEALKGTRSYAKENIEALKNDFTQPNAVRLLDWVLFLFDNNQANLKSISQYIGCIGREWLMLTMDEDLKEWITNDYEEIYEQIILSKVKDARKEDSLRKDPIDDRDDIELDDEDIKNSEDDNLEDPVSDVEQTLESSDSKDQQSTSSKISNLIPMGDYALFIDIRCSISMLLMWFLLGGETNRSSKREWSLLEYITPCLTRYKYLN